MRCPNCGESNKKDARFCSNCATPLSGVAGRVERDGKRPLGAFAISMVAVVGMIAVSLSMSFVDDAPGDIGSPIEGVFHAAGALQLLLGLGVMVSAMFLVIRGFDVELWGKIIAGLGALSVAIELAVVVGGTFAVIFLAIPGALAVVGGALAARTGRQNAAPMVQVSS